MPRGRSSLLLLPLAALLSAVAAFCPPRCECDDITLTADCTGAQLDSFPITLNPRLRRLILVDNAIRRLDTSMVSSYTHLEFLDMRRNGMLSVQANSFERQQRLLELRLGQNQLGQLEEGVFNGLRRLRVLDLSANQLREVPDDALRPLQMLTDLDLSENRLAALSRDALSGAVSLRRLSLASNLLTAVPTEALQQLSQLDDLSLAGNSIERLSAGELGRAAPALTQLSLAGNRIAPLPDGVFDGLSGLRQLNVADIGLDSADEETFAGLDRLEELHLSGNPLSRLGPAPLERLHRLTLLSVRACPGLNTIEPDTFKHNPALATLRLEENPNLTKLPDKLLLFLPLLRSLSLHANSLSSLTESTADWRNLAADLGGNPWRCDCALRWLAELPPEVNISGAICAAPDRLRGSSVRGLSAEDLDCGAADSSSMGLVIGLSVGAAVLLLALAVGACYRYRRRLHKMFKVLPWRERVGLKRKQEPYHRGQTYYCHDMYDPIHPRDKPIPVTEL
ncbi:insulin-like growth factor-binding protein complex acid labile subunit [Amphibalanus amphitrite]|uniref:insulin-like growth factor-binding protein complex acid labile subunit n=1 Tax=Amphibalanus amphitrite TaxID=1232801 RepID=UPI001C90EA1B|nr:insulin-like growth factor-binding protein complex acid labile subunit [Amphibalanus amphitrite]XP_043205624.1 insulin-like growth factor-binding protein complex acid labile subunit [Amphibalanus amphitrite]